MREDGEDRRTDPYRLGPAFPADAASPLSRQVSAEAGPAGFGPSLYAYRPWNPTTGRPPPHRARLGSAVLLQYATSPQTNRMTRALRGYPHPDEWKGGAWITTPSGKTAVAKYWYGFVHPAEPTRTCVHAAPVGQVPACRAADGG